MVLVYPFFWILQPLVFVLVHPRKTSEVFRNLGGLIGASVT